MTAIRAGRERDQPPASEADVERLRQMVEKHCPVLDDLRAPVPVTMEVLKARRAAKSAVR
jgi:hypothetical protein